MGITDPTMQDKIITITKVGTSLGVIVGYCDGGFCYIDEFIDRGWIVPTNAS